MTSLYSRISYLIFRLFYTSSHWLAFSFLKSNPSHEDIHKKENIIICGIEPVDTFAIEKLSLFLKLCEKHYPDKAVYLFSKLSEIKKIEEIPDLSVVHWEYQERARLLGRSMKLLYRKGHFNEELIFEIARKGFAMVDLGDHQATSEKSTGFTANLLANITFSKRFEIPYYMMPQSFGPFDYDFPMKATLKPMLRAILPSVKCIYVRESSSLHELQKLTTDLNIKTASDFLLHFKDIGAINLETDGNLTFVPDLNLLNRPKQFIQDVEAINSVATNNKLGSLSIKCYDKEDTKKLSTTPLKNNSIAPAQAPTNIILTSKYHFAIHSILQGNPAVYWKPNKAGIHLYSELGLERLIANDRPSLELAIQNLTAIQQDPIAKSRIDTHLTQIRNASIPFFEQQ